MTSRERVQRTIRRQAVDRLPIYGWVRANLSDSIARRFGSCDAFEDHFGFDLAHLFGGPACYIVNDDYWRRWKAGEEIEPEEVADLPLNDPDDAAAYEGLKAQIAHHRQRDRFLYVQTPGIFEKLNSTFGIENQLCHLLTDPEAMRRIYERQAAWNTRFAMNCLDLGVDMIHISDDWGAQNSLLFSPAIWWDLIYPAQKKVVDAVKARGAFVSLHSDGNINQVLDGIIQLGFDVVHPWQESAGMSLDLFKSQYADRFTVMGGLDVQTTLGFGRMDEVRRAIERLLRLFRDGGLILCTTHFVQSHCSIEELEQTYQWVVELNR